MDQLYFESGYIDDNYFVYTASAASSLSSTATISVTAGRIKGAVVNFSGVFTASMTVNAVRNGGIALTSTVTLSVQPVVNRATSITLSSIANVNAQAVKTAPSSATMAAAFSLSAQALDVIQFSAVFPTVSATVTTNKYFGDFVYSSGRPRNFTNGTYVTSEKKFGTHSLAGYVEGTFSSLTPSPTVDWMFEFWDKDIRDGCEIDLGFIYITPFSSTDRRHIFRLRNGLGNTFVQATSPTPSVGSFDHWAIVKTGPNLSYYLNGSRFYTANISLAQELKTSGYLLIGIGGTLGGGSPNRIDEVSLWIGDTFGNDATSSTITVPISARTNSRSYTQALWHFDGNGTDDTVILENYSANLTSTATINVSGIKLSQTNANLTSTATATIIALANKPAEANLESIFGIDTQVVKLTEASASLSSEFTQTLAVDIIREFASSQDAEFTQSALQSVTRDFLVDEQAAFTSSITIRATKVGDIDLDVTADLSAQGAKTTGYSADFAVQTDQSTEISAIRDAELTIDEFIFGWDANIDRVRAVDASMASDCALTADADKFKVAVIDISAIFAQDTQISKIADVDLNMISESAQSASGDRTRDADSAQSAAFEQTVIGTRTQEFQSQLASAFTQTAQAVKITDTTSAQSASFAQNANAVKTVDVAVQEDVIASQITVIALIANRESQLTATTAMSVVIGKLVEFPANETWINYGVSSYDFDKYPRILMDLPVNQINVRDNGFTLSIWIKRDSIPTNTFQPMVSNLTQLDQHWGAFTFRNNDIIIRQNFDPDEPNPTWQNVSTDTDWHHYLFYTTNKGNVNDSYYRLWIDGVYQGERTYSAYNVSVAFNDNNYLTLGRAAIAGLSLPYSVDNYGADLGFAQVWLGSIPSNSGANWSPPVSLFYDQGYVDLEADGRGPDDLLPTPYVYDTLDQYWSNIEFRPTVYGIGDGPYTADQKPASEPLVAPFVSWFTLSAKTEGVFLYTVNLAATAQLTANGFRTLELASTQSSEFAQSTLIGVTRQGAENISAEFAQTTQAVKTVDVQSTQNSEFAFTADVGDQDNAEADLSAEFALECQAIKIDPTRASALLQSTAALEISADVIVNNRVDAQAEFTLTAAVTAIPPVRVEADLNSEFTLTATIGSIEQFAVLVVSAGTLTVDVDRLADALVPLNSNVTLSAEVQRQFRTTSANLQAGAFQLTAGDVINLDPALTLKISAESRELIILPETRLYTVKQETRILEIYQG